ncbi:glutaredoxin [Endozoicomonas montiporae]|uniref:Glutaredoxin n=2 Tax=Endozoicomonas montiporae TaxID=1027273 RepID=A0A081NCC8_9GAMM|nr:GrxA family glutaredoxin [Endozoicomonas montiporae]AMO56434.1 glutaredoxin 1 [Endozoicomonas montiporae CL-33]KEQ16101.1 glutaredoxin [Endozoicomonas montiporae]
MDRFTVFGRPGCGFCVRAKQVLEDRQLPFLYVDIHAEGISKDDLEKTVGKPVETVPQIFHGQRYIGGYTELEAYLKDELVSG